MKEPPVRPLTPTEAHPSNDGSRNASPLAAPVLGVIAAALILWWPSPVEDDQVAPIPIEPVVTIGAPVPPPSRAVVSFQSFVSAVNQGDTATSIRLLKPELPDVAGLGTFSYPLLGNDPGLWTAGALDARKVTDFVGEPSGLPEAVAVSNCSAFGDGPAVTIVACDYSAGGVFAFPSFRPELGTVFGFMVDSMVAGVAYNSGPDDPGPIP